MLDILVAELAAVATHSEADVVPASLVPCSRVLRPERLDGVSAFDADGHLGCGSPAAAAELLQR